MSPYIEQADFFIQRGQHARAVNALNSHLSSDPENGWAHGMLSLSHSNLKQFEKAKHHAGESIRLLPEESFGFMAMGYAEFSQNRLAEAVHWIKQALAIDPDSETNLEMLASIRTKQGHVAAAQEAIRQCLRLHPENVACLNLRAALEIDLGHYWKAEQTLEKALKVDPESSTAHINRGVAMMAAGWECAGIDSVHEGLRIEPNSETGRLVLLHALKLKNQVVLLLMGLRRILELPGPFALFFILWLYAACEGYVGDVPPRALVGDSVLAAVFAAFALVVFAGPLSDFYVLLYRSGRLASTEEEQRLTFWHSSLAVAYTALYGAFLFLDQTRSFAGGMFVLLIAAIPAFTQRQYTWNPWRLKMLAMLTIAPLFVIAPLLAAMVSPAMVDKHIPTHGSALVVYEGAIGTATMVTLYVLSWRESRLQ